MATGGVKIGFQDFPGHPLAKTLSSQCRVPGSIPGWGTKSHMPQLNTPHAVNKTWCNQRGKKSILVGFLHVLCQAPTPTVAPPTPPPTTCLLSVFAFPLQSFCLHPTPSPHTSPVCPATQVGAHRRLSQGFKRLFMPPGKCSQGALGQAGSDWVMSSGRSRRLFL